ncbi:ATP-binding protein [Streptomyces sp. NPDC101132]|uniref:ATP-binding protein n=1 Tax=Streptomyces sp. NPDC101132 TaxID=3366110 RepID=UPI0037FC7067
MSATTAPPVWRTALPRTAAAVPLARAVVRSALAGPGAPVDPDTAELLTAELVANAVEHAGAGAGADTGAGAAVELVVELLPEGCRIEVHDGDPRPPGALTPAVPGEHPDPLQEHGRGLLLLRTLSASCGHRPTPRGKAVWFTLSARPRPRRGGCDLGRPAGV